MEAHLSLAGEILLNSKHSRDALFHAQPILGDIFEEKTGNLNASVAVATTSAKMNQATVDNGDGDSAST